MGCYYDSSLSRRHILPFIQSYNVPLDEFEDGPFDTFNEFFVRRFKPGRRKFPTEPSSMGALAEGRYFGFEKVDAHTAIPVKGVYLQPKELLADDGWGEVFRGGPCLIARLCPVDYHRFHFPDFGQVERSYSIPGQLHSVNPLALSVRPKVMIQNLRQVTLVSTESFGKLAIIEVGALGVGSILQTYGNRREVQRGDEKGYFKFGGSTVILLGQAGRWIPDSDILEQTQKGYETYLQLGQKVANAT